jgi:hypothetical protein
MLGSVGTLRRAATLGDVCAFAIRSMTKENSEETMLETGQEGSGAAGNLRPLCQPGQRAMVRASPTAGRGLRLPLFMTKCVT